MIFSKLCDCVSWCFDGFLVIVDLVNVLVSVNDNFCESVYGLLFLS